LASSCEWETSGWIIPISPMAVAQRIVHHRQIARLEDVERHLARAAAARPVAETPESPGKVAGPAVIGIDRHWRSPMFA